MKDFLFGFLLASIFSVVLMGIMYIDYQRQFRELEVQAYHEVHQKRLEVRALTQEIRLLYNDRRVKCGRSS